MLYLYIIIYRENKTVGVFLIGVRVSWCWWVISPDGGRVPHRWSFLLVLVGIFQTDPGRGHEIGRAHV